MSNMIWLIGLEHKIILICDVLCMLVNQKHLKVSFYLHFPRIRLASGKQNGFPKN